jgi:hypothetical protein
MPIAAIERTIARYAVFFGRLYVILAFRLRKYRQT